MNQDKEWRMDESALALTDLCLEQWLGERARVSFGTGSSDRQWSAPFYSTSGPTSPSHIRTGNLRVSGDENFYSSTVELDASLAGAIAVVPTLSGGGFLLQVDGKSRALLANGYTDLRKIEVDVEVVSVVGATDLTGIDRLSRCKSLRIAGKEKPQGLDLVARMKSLNQLSLTRMKDLHSIDFLRGAQRLETLDISKCMGLCNLDALGSLPDLTSFYFAGDIGTETMWDETPPLRLDLAQLARSKSLRELVVRDVPVSNIDSLSAMSRLGRLELHRAHCAQQLSAIGQLANLLTFYGPAHLFEDGRQLAQLVNLKSLSLRGLPDNEDLHWLSGMQDLEYLKVWFREHDLNMLDLPALPKLKTLCMGFGEASCNAKSIGRFAKLEKLYLSDWKAADYSALGNLPLLKKLDIQKSAARSLRGLEALGELESLEVPLPGGDVELTSLTSLTSLRHLRLKNAGDINSLRFIAPLKRLEELDLQGASKLRSLADCPDVTSLRSLELSKCNKLHSLEGIQNLSGLTELSLCEVPDNLDLTPLNRLPNLEEFRTTLESVRSIYLQLHVGDKVIPPSGLDEGFEILCKSPTLRILRLDDYAHRSAEIEAELAMERGDVRHVRSQAEAWTELVEWAPNPERTAPRILRAMVECAETPSDWRRVEKLVAFLHKWGTAWEAACEVLEKHGLPVR